MDNEDEFSKYTPQHPLPKEVQKMNRDETVCKFCGVSYLIHNEIKALEDKLKLAEKELEHYRGSEKREEQLRNELNAAKNENEKNQQVLLEKDDVINTLRNNLKDSEEEKHVIQKSKTELSEKYQNISVNCEILRQKHSLLYNRLPSILSDLSQQRELLSSIRDTVLARDHVFNEDSQHLKRSVVNVCEEQIEKNRASQVRLHELENERLSFKFKEEKYVSEIKAYEARLAQLEETSGETEARLALLQQSNAEAQIIKRQCQDLHTSNNALETEITSVQQKNRQLTLEAQQYQDQLRRLHEEHEQNQSQMRHTEMAAQQHTIKIEKDLKEKENELHTVARELGRMKTKFVEQQEELDKSNSLSGLKTKALHEELIRCKGDLSALKQEREMMITAHQNQIEQLRDSFRKKMSDNEKWPEKVDEILKKEKEKHNRELFELEQKLKENFIYELQIEKQKQHELTEKYVSEVQESEQTLRNQFNNVDNKNKSEVSELHKQLAEYKARARENENMLRQEISSLKKIITDLEQRLGRLDSGSDEKVNELKFEIKKLENEMGTLTDEKRKVQEMLNASKEENGFLQETVRRECEERFELTETLSTIKEELLQYKRPPGGYSQSPHPPQHNNQNSESGSILSPSSEEMMLFKKSANPRPPAHARESTNSNNVMLGYTGQSARSTGSLRGGRSSSLGDSRKRISEAVGRKS